MSFVTRRVPLFQGLRSMNLDAFTETPYRGNPAAVCLLGLEGGVVMKLSTEVRQQMAAENNVSETAFVELCTPSDSFEKSSHFKLRWFTPAIEVPLCGHATLAAAAVLFGELGNQSEEIVFDTMSGPLSVVNASSPGDAHPRLSMSLPAMHASDDLPSACQDTNAQLVQALCGGLKVQEVRYERKVKYLLIVLDPTTKRAELEAMQPDLAAVEKCSRDGEVTGCIVALQTDDDDVHVCSRFFAPWAGIGEDPVTGSAHAVIGPYLFKKTGHHDLEARQVSKRGGVLHLAMVSDVAPVVVTGSAVVTIVGHMIVPVA